MKWLNNPQTLEELKKQYKRLAMMHHPDVGGNVKDIVESAPRNKALKDR